MKKNIYFVCFLFLKQTVPSSKYECSKNSILHREQKSRIEIFFENKKKIWISVTWVDNMRAMFFHEKVLKVS